MPPPPWQHSVRRIISVPITGRVPRNRPASPIMKLKPAAILCVSLAALFVSCTHLGQRGKAAAPDSVFPRLTLYPAQQPVPRPVIDSLPRRISALPQGRSVTIRRLVERLGLSAYRDNVSVNHRWGIYFMYLDSSHIL